MRITEKKPGTNTGLSEELPKGQNAPVTEKTKRVFVALSGGADSAVSAYLLVQEGYEVVGISMSIGSAGGAKENPADDSHMMDVGSARRVAERLGIPLHVVDVKRDFNRHVVDYFCREYMEGRTPNPCIKCNERVKLGTLWKSAERLGAQILATGHYARVTYDSERRRYVLRKGRDRRKDQSYVLFSLSQDQLSHLRFPLGDTDKGQVRETARTLGITIADTTESQDICFIRGRNYRRYLRHRLGGHFGTGDIVDLQGRVLGTHDGIYGYTIGQRRGLGVSVGHPLYVIDIDPVANRVIVGSESETFTDRCLAFGVNWMAAESLTEPQDVEARIRYNHPGAEATVEPIAADRVRVRFKYPQKAVTPGQAVVFYQGDLLLGGGWIERESHV